MTTAAELRHYLETGDGGPQTGQEFTIKNYTANNLRNLAAEFGLLQSWLTGENTFHNSVRSYLQSIGIAKTGLYSFNQVKGSGDIVELALGTRYLALSYPFCKRVQDRFPKNKQMMGMGDIAIGLCQLMAVGWKDHSEFYARLALGSYPDMLYDGISTPQVPHFILDLVNDWLQTNIVIDGPYKQSELYATTRIPGSEVYQELLAIWRTPDWKAFDAVLSKAAQYHVDQSRMDTDFVNARGEQDERAFEFIDPTYWLFPIELFAVLRLREWHGLRNPEPPSHPLFSVSMLGKMPENVPVWPADPLLDAVEAKYASILPELPPLLTLADLPRLRLEQSRPAGSA